jgi:cyclophilin family peptidyl-prolyl cis-trans isomerase
MSSQSTNIAQIQGGDPTGTGRGGKSFWGEPFRDEYSEKGAYKHDARGVLVSHTFDPISINFRTHR